MENADMANGNMKILFFMPFKLHVALIFYLKKKKKSSKLNLFELIECIN